MKDILENVYFLIALRNIKICSSHQSAILWAYTHFHQMERSRDSAKELVVDFTGHQIDAGFYQKAMKDGIGKDETSVKTFEDFTRNEVKMSKSVNVKTILTKWLQENGYDGLSSGEYCGCGCGCYCDIGELMPCTRECASCKPAYKTTDEYGNAVYTTEKPDGND